MADLPIIFSAPMVRALLDGRKTQTRRILKPQPQPFKLHDGHECDVCLTQNEHDRFPRVTLGRVITKQEVRFSPGDRLWVREAVARIDNSEFGQGRYWEYRADTNGQCLPGDWPDDERDNPDRPRWRPSIHMPREASRISLLVTGVRVERLNDITEADAIAEGATPIIDHGTGSSHQLYRIGFEHLWCSINGQHAWLANPFVVAITFRVIKANIDAPEARAA